VRVGDFLSLGGTLGFEQYRETVTLSGGGTVDSRLMVLTGADVSARLATSSGADAIGVAMTGLDFGLVLAQASAPGDARSWLSVRGQADSVAILGTQALGVTLSGTNVMFAANVGLGSAADGSANRTTLDWSGARKLTLQAGDSPAAVIDVSGEVLEVGGTMLIEVGGVFSASGTVLVSKQDRDVLVGGQTVRTTTASTLRLGLPFWVYIGKTTRCSTPSRRCSSGWKSCSESRKSGTPRPPSRQERKSVTHAAR
jgi:hypothetical protein